MTESVLIVDDDPIVRKMMISILSRRLGLAVTEAGSGEEALGRLARGGICLAMIDYHMPGMDGFTLLDQMLRKSPKLPVIMVTSEENTEAVVRAMRAGAYDYITKSAEPERIIVSVQNALRMYNLQNEVKHLRQKKGIALRFDDIVGHDSGLSDVVMIARKVSPTDVSLLLTGETGTGKEVFARAVHEESPRALKPFVAVNCGAIPHGLLESTLFGHEKGAFTGAVVRMPGRFRDADGGTIFLDEVGELSADGQVNLLRVLQQKEITPVGGGTPVPVDVRVIAATNRDLASMVSQGTFREDLFFRLNVVHLHLPPLRARRQDISLLVHHFIRRQAAETGQPLREATPAFIEALSRYNWPGNVRELENVLQRIFILSDRTILLPEEFIIEGIERLSNPSAALLEQKGIPLEHTLNLKGPDGSLRSLQEIIEYTIHHAIKCSDENISAAAKSLGVARSTLYKKIK